MRHHEQEVEPKQRRGCTLRAVERPHYFISDGPRVGHGEETSSAGRQDERALASAGDYVGAILSSCIPTPTFFF